MCNLKSSTAFNKLAMAWNYKAWLTEVMFEHPVGISDQIKPPSVTVVLLHFYCALMPQI